MKRKTTALVPLWTEEGQGLRGTPWTVYPRPQMVRNDWMCLNGDWDFIADHRPARVIRVPFCPESLLSGIAETYPKGAHLIYEKKFTVPDSWDGKHILLHFGAVDQLCEVFVNDCKVGEHVGGYLSFSFDITSALVEGPNTIRVNVTDELNHRYPWGKQANNRGGIWYTPTSGIWKTVWLEPVCEKHIESLKIDVTLHSVTIAANGVQNGAVTLQGQVYDLVDGKVTIEIERPQLWSPEHPHLYAFSVTSGDDTVSSYFALRTLETKTVDGVPRLCLNGEPYFFNGLLDQGYWSDGLYTPATPNGFTLDIETMKKLGFNTLRKHIKVEPEEFYYQCDRIGMIVFQDMVNNGEYSEIHDGFFPAILGMTRLGDTRWSPKKKTREMFWSHMEQTIRTLYNHPCICLWTVFNEGWGQFCADEGYDRAKALDASRFVDATSGWFWQSKSDVASQHIYRRPIELDAKDARPQLISEYGGYAWKLDDHSANLDRTYGYADCKTRDAFADALNKLWESEVRPLAKAGLCGAIYTQVSDVEDEVNGMFTYDRKVLKVDGDMDLSVHF